jgi:hypothetical protein
LSSFFGLELETVYYNRQKLAAIGILVPVVIVAMGILWRIRRWRMQRRVA